LRTAWVYSPFGKNFVKTMLKLAETRDALSVVYDQKGNPTSALDIADAIIQVADRLAATPEFSAYGIYHLVGTGDTNWSGFARAIFSESAKLGGPTAIVTDIATADYPTKAVRPANSRLSTTKFEKVFNWTAPHWQCVITGCGGEIEKCLAAFILVQKEKSASGGNLIVMFRWFIFCISADCGEFGLTP